MLMKATSHRELDEEALLAVYAGSLRDDGQVLRYLREDFFTIPGAACYIWQEAGEYKSVLRVEPYLDGFLIAGLETRPDSRNRGYASRLLAAVADAYAGKPLYAHIRRKNTASIRVHTRCGFCKLFDYGKMLDGSVDSRYNTYRKM